MMPTASLSAIESERASPKQIAERIVDAILAGRLQPGQRLGEQVLAELFGVSRTLVREALTRLSARGIVEVHPRRGWFVVQPSRQEAEQAFAARVAIETGLLHCLPSRLPPAAIERLQRHVRAEEAAVRDGDPGERSFMLGDFHVCLAECTGNALLADILKDLTARTTLIAALFQSTHDASHSCGEHAQIVAALQAGDHALAIERLRQHIETVADHLRQPPASPEPLAVLRHALAPVSPLSTTPATG